MNSGWMWKPPTKLKPFSSGNSKVKRRAGGEENDERQADEERQADPERRERSARSPAAAGAPRSRGRTTATIADQDGDQRSRRSPRPDDRARQEQAAIAEIGAERQSVAPAAAPGRTESTALYQKRSCSSTGMLRNVST